MKTLSVAAEAGGVAVPGLSAAGGMVETIHASIEQVTIHREKCITLSKKCDQMRLILNENQSTIEDDEFKEALDELLPALERVSKGVSKWRFYPGWKLWFRSAEIDSKLTLFTNDVDIAMQRFDSKAKIISQKQHERNGAILREQTVRLDEIMILLKEGRKEEILDEARKDPQAVRHAMGDLGARVQEMAMFERAGRPRVPYVSSPRNMTLASDAEADPDVDADVETSSQNSDNQHSEEYRQLKKAMQELLMLDLPTEVAVLDGQVTRNTDGLLRSSARADVWTGKWYGRDVALKGYRSLKKGDQVNSRFVKELKVWNQLHDDHIVQFYGITYDIGKTVYIVSAYQGNRDVFSRLEAYKWELRDKGVAPPDFDRMKLMRGAAQGLAYLHSCGIVHGNMKCSKIYISIDNEAKLGDFGMSKLLEEVAEDAGAITEVSSSRFSVPELFERDRVPDIATDIWQFASCVLHCFSNEVPYHDIKRNGQVVRELMDGKHPNRPTNTDLCTRWITDDVWALLVSCWAFDPTKRPTMAQNRQAMIRIERAIDRKRTQTGSV